MAQIAGGLFIDRTAIFASPLFDHLIAPRRFQFKRLADVRFGLFVRGVIARREPAHLLQAVACAKNLGPIARGFLFNATASSS